MILQIIGTRKINLFATALYTHHFPAGKVITSAPTITIWYVKTLLGRQKKHKILQKSATFRSSVSSNIINTYVRNKCQMIFSSLEFIFQFLPVFLVLYYVCPDRAKKISACLQEACFFLFLWSCGSSGLYGAFAVVCLRQLLHWQENETIPISLKTREMASPGNCLQPVLADPV